ncbi:hypothetical protein TIFTF001_031920 [Ficus carica]|uniref:Uncharacterized protein n=1 Tax=Ficus carica TaxID=3494 RepID=A0AA88DVK2_FICCA|nr:hypothetical protein TIFTF001_031920 [Ficus carica]
MLVGSQIFFPLNSFAVKFWWQKAITRYQTPFPTSTPWNQTQQIETPNTHESISPTHTPATTKTSPNPTPPLASPQAESTTAPLLDTLPLRPFTAPSSDLRCAVSRPLSSDYCAVTSFTIPSLRRCQYFAVAIYYQSPP